MDDTTPRKQIFKFINVIKTEVTRNSHISIAVGNDRPNALLIGLENGANGVTVAFNKTEAIQLRERLVEAINTMTE